jgi:hypothetical protein
MKSKHITDNEIQQFVLDETSCPFGTIDHMRVCRNCRAKAETYKLLFSEIKRQPKPAFDFDLTELVLSNIVHKEAVDSQTSALIWLFTIIALGSVVITIYLFGNYTIRVFAGVSSMAMYLVVTTSVLLLLLQGIQMFRKYRKQMASLDVN